MLTHLEILFPGNTMLAIDIPAFGDLRLAHLVLDFNGTLACDGVLLPGVAPLLARLAATLEIHVVTADTFGRAADELAGSAVDLRVLGEGDQAQAKLEVVRALGARSVVAIGNGRNDEQMLAAAALGIAVVQREGAAGASLRNADVVAPGIIEALELLVSPRRLVATLRA